QNHTHYHPNHTPIHLFLRVKRYGIHVHRHFLFSLNRVRLREKERENEGGGGGEETRLDSSDSPFRSTEEKEASHNLRRSTLRQGTTE
ncbi:hypothetical protein JZ751_013804, partial [Albula glossodonta]